MIFINYYIIYFIDNVIVFICKIFMNLLLILLFNYKNKNKINE